MIAAIGKQRGTDPGGLVNYLFGPGHANEHVNPRTVAGTVHFPAAGGKVATQVAADLRLPQRLWPDVSFPGGHVWHCSLALGAPEGDLPDQKWAAIADDFMVGMKLVDAQSAPVRWTAVHHGPSAEGNAHIHLVVNLVREDGSKVNIWQDMPRSQVVVQELERKYGLQVLQTRSAVPGAGSVPYSQAEVARARKTNTPIERVEVERIVRGLAGASIDEAEFVRRLRDSELTVRPYPPSGAVTGYSVGKTPPAGEPPLFFQGGKLARDLTLPRLRLTWGQTPEATAAAQLEWRRGAPGTPVSRSAREVKGIPATPDAAAAVLHDLQQLGDALDGASPDAFARLSGEIAGVTAAAAEAAPPGEREQFRRASREIGGWAGTRRPGPVGSRLGPSAALAFLQAMNPRSEWAKAYMLRQLLDAVLELHRLHRARRSVATVTGGTARMSEQPDDVDGVFGDAVITSATTTATLIAARARKQHDGTVAAQSRGRLRDRFRRQTEATAWSPGNAPAPVTPTPKGLRGMYSDQAWSELTDIERHLVDPNKVGVWPTDYHHGTPGASMRATADQIERSGLLGDALGRSGKGAEVANLTRVDAARILSALEADAGPRLAKETYHAAGMAYRSKEIVETSSECFDMKYTIQFPPDPSSPAANQAAPAVLPGSPAASAPAVTPTRASRPTPRLDDPSTWRTAGEPVRPPQKVKLLSYGHVADEIDKLDKGHASLVIRAHVNEGDVAGHAAMDDALAAMERGRLSDASCPARPGAKPQQGPTRTV